MSEQEMELESAIQGFQEASDFAEFEAGLSDVIKKSTKMADPHAARERVITLVNEKKADLMLSSPEFKVIMDHREREAKMKGEENRATHKAKMAEITAKAKLTIAQSRSKAARIIKDVEHFVAKTKYKVVNPEELQRKSKEGLWCPICRIKDTLNNTLNSKPICMTCMHELVTEENLSKYNREYRRRWKRSKKK